MGTNYYIRSKPCEQCGRSDPDLHIGKSSGGWCFSLHVEESDTHPSNIQDWMLVFQESDIVDEYDSSVSAKEMIDIITDRSFSAQPASKHFYDGNNAVPGPNGLARHVIDGKFCIGHGDGTWDLLVGDFS